MLWKVYRTVIEMLQDRGVDLDTPIIKTLTDFENVFGPFEEANRNSMAFVTVQPRIGVFFADQKNLLVEHVRTYERTMIEKHIKHGILVTRNALTSQCRKILNESKLYIEAFKEAELVLNITKHVLVPKHIKLPSTQTLFDKKTAAHLPKLHRGDPCSRYYGFHKGDIIEIKRHSPTAGDRGKAESIIQQLEAVCENELDSIVRIERLQILHKAVLSGLDEYCGKLAEYSLTFRNKLGRSSIFQEINFSAFDMVRAQHPDQFNNVNDLDDSNLKKFDEWSAKFLYRIFLVRIITEMMNKYPEDIPLMTQFAGISLT